MQDTVRSIRACNVICALRRATRWTTRSSTMNTRKICQCWSPTLHGEHLSSARHATCDVALGWVGATCIQSCALLVMLDVPQLFNPSHNLQFVKPQKGRIYETRSHDWIAGGALTVIMPCRYVETTFVRIYLQLDQSALHAHHVQYELRVSHEISFQISVDRHFRGKTFQKEDISGGNLGPACK